MDNEREETPLAEKATGKKTLAFALPALPPLPTAAPPTSNAPPDSNALSLSRNFHSFVKNIRAHQEGATQALLSQGNADSAQGASQVPENEHSAGVHVSASEGASSPASSKSAAHLPPLASLSILNPHSLPPPGPYDPSFTATAAAPTPSSPYNYPSQRSSSSQIRPPPFVPAPSLPSTFPSSSSFRISNLLSPADSPPSTSAASTPQAPPLTSSWKPPALPSFSSPPPAPAPATPSLSSSSPSPSSLASAYEAYRQQAAMMAAAGSPSAFPFFVHPPSHMQPPYPVAPVPPYHAHPFSTPTTLVPPAMLQQQAPAEPRTFLCQWGACDLSFSTRTGLATHTATHLEAFVDPAEGKRPRLAPLRCEWRGCGKQFGSLKQLAKHLSHESHIGQTPFLPKPEEQPNKTNSLATTSSTSGGTTTQQAAPSAEAEQALEDDAAEALLDFPASAGMKRKKRYNCSIPGCNKSFTDSSNRKKHERTHDANRERYHCVEPGCFKSYSTKTDLKIHVKVHKGEYPHKCTHPNCGKAFVRLSELYAHERTHDNILPHVCTQCGKRFREKSRLKRHEQVHQVPGAPEAEGSSQLPPVLTNI